MKIGNTLSARFANGMFAAQHGSWNGEPRNGYQVIDTGIGIAPEDLQKLFQPFVQIDSGWNRQQEGTGLGLALVQRLTDLHGGSVQVESEVGKGSRFTVSLPRRQAEIATDEPLPFQTLSAVSEQTQNTDVSALAPEPCGVILFGLEIHWYLCLARQVDT